MSYTEQVKRWYPCEECYTQASQDANGNEEQGALAYDFLHYEYNHGNKELLWPDLFTKESK